VARTAEGDLGEVVAFENVEHLQGRDALTVGGQLPHVVAAIVGGHRLHPFAAVGGQVFITQEAALGLHVGIDAAGDLALVEGVPTALGDEVEGCGQAGIAEDLAVARRPLPIHREGLQEARELA